MSNGKLFLAYTYSPLHAGVGQTTGVVDLPIEREKHTGYPCVYATGLKGSLRSYWKQNNYHDLEDIFGKEEASAGAGGLIFTDLKILLFPVRASEGTFKWVTCQKVINRFKRDCKIATDQEVTLPAIEELQLMENVPDSPNFSQYLILDDYLFKKCQANTQAYFFLKEIEAKNICLVKNDLFDYFVNHATQIIARNKLKDNKVSDNLWYEETLPADTLLYSFVMPSIIGNTNHVGTFETNLKEKIIQIGGGETVGYGITKLSFLNESDKKKEEI